MTPKQRELARHALGLPNPSNRSYRNRFVMGDGHRDYADWQAMVSADEATMVPRAAPNTMDWFHLTRFGAELALLEDERINPEDFPAETTHV